MAVTKQYVIEIQLDQARQALDDTTKKLTKLDGQLEGLDRDGAAAKGIVKDMAAAAAQVEKLTASVGGLEGKLDGLVPLGPGTIGALRQEVEALQAALNNTIVGSKEAADTIALLGEKKSALRGLANEMNALNPRAQARAFTVFAGALAGATGIATTAAQVFGLSNDTAEKYTQKMQALVGVLYSLEQVNKALNGENLALGKSILSGAKAWLGFGESASAAGKVTRAALIGTGIGLLIIAVGLLVANFDKVKAVGAEIAARFKPEFDAIGAVIDAVAAKTRNLLAVFGLADDAATHLAKVQLEAAQKQLTTEADQSDRLIAILKARGDDTLKLEVENARKRAAAAQVADKEATDDQKKAAADAVKEYAVLRAQLQKRGDDEENSARLAHLNGQATLESAKGKATFAQQLAAKHEQIIQLNEAELNGLRVTDEQKEQLQTELSALELGHQKEQDDRRRALLTARLQGQLAILQAQGGDEYRLLVGQNALELKLAQQHAKDLREAAQPDAAAIVAAENRVFVLRIQAADIFYKERQKQDAAHQASIQTEIEGPYVRGLIREKKYQADLAVVRAGAAKVNEQLAAEEAERLKLIAQQQAADDDGVGNLLMRLFSLTDPQAQELKAQIANFANQASNAVSALMNAAQDAVDQRLSDTQARLQAVSDQLSTLQGTIASDESALASASGAKRDYLLAKINNERAAEEKLSAAKTKAAADEAKAELAKQKLTKESTQLTLASGLASTVAAGAKSVEAAVGVIAGGSDLPFPANIVAIAAGLGVVVAAVAQARSLSKTFAAGGVVDANGILQGPRHAQGGIPFTVAGQPGFEAEGGETITPVDASQKNAKALALIRTAGRTRVLGPADFAQIADVRVLPPPAGHFAAGGVVGTGRDAAPGTVNVSSADLSQLIGLTQQVVAHVQATAAHTQAVAGFGPPVLAFGQEAEIRRQELARGMTDAKAGASL